jgi:hypothetical protein
MPHYQLFVTKHKTYSPTTLPYFLKVLDLCRFVDLPHLWGLIFLPFFLNVSPRSSVSLTSEIHFSSNSLQSPQLDL